MANTITSFVRNAAIDRILNPATQQASSTQQSTNNATATSTAANTTDKSNSRSEAAQYTAVQQSLANGKTAISAASQANNDIDSALKNVKDIAGKLADNNITGSAREKLQAEYSKARDSIIASQEKASVKTGETQTADNKTQAVKTNLLTDSKNQTVSTNTRGGQLEIKAGGNAKALGLPEKINSAAEAQTLLAGDANQAGSLARAQQQTNNNRKTLQQADEDVSKRLQTASNVAKSVQQLENARSGNKELSADKAEQRDRAFALARDVSAQVKNQLEGLTGGFGKSRSNSLSGLFG